MNISAVAKLLGEIYKLLGKRGKSLPFMVVLGAVLASIDVLGLFFLGKYVAMTSSEESNISLDLFGWIVNVSLGYLAIILGVVYVGRAIIGILANKKIHLISANIEADLKATLLLQYQTMPYADRMRRGVGEMAEAVNGWTASFARSVVAPMSRFISESIISLSICCYFLYLYPQLMLLFCFLACVVGLLYDSSVKRKANENASSYRLMSALVSEEVQNTLMGYKEIIGFGLPKFFAIKVHSKATEMCKSLASAITFAQAPRFVIEAFLVVSTVFALWGMAFLGKETKDELPNIAIIAVGLMRITTWFSLATSMLSNLRLYRPIVSSLSIDLNIGDKSFIGVSVPTLTKVVARKINYLLAENLSFAYDGNVAVFSGLSFKISTGDRVAIIGPSGAGKTTLLDVMIGLIKPTKGRLLVEISDGSVQGNLLNVGTYLSQSTFILNDTVRRNVALGVPDKEIDDEIVKISLRRAMLSEFANDSSIDRVIGSLGGMISGGQRQRVAIARALYFGRSVFLFDEATSALDLQTETEIISLLINMGPDITIIVVTHNPEVAKMFEKQIEIKVAPPNRAVLKRSTEVDHT